MTANGDNNDSNSVAHPGDSDEGVASMVMMAVDGD